MSFFDGHSSLLLKGVTLYYIVDYHYYLYYYYNGASTPEY